MGVKGLTTYIANKADQYLVPFELHDTCLVIDGDSLASNLYSWSPNTNSAFGGDYNQYHHIVQRFFATLHKCRVRSFVLLDGGYQRRKLRTVHSRLRSKICSVRHLNPLGGNHLFPLHLRECFVDAVRSSPGARLMRCMFEADDEVAQLARQLNCPVLSYDSDFYIHNVQYIPSVTLTMRPLRREAPRRNRRRPAQTSRTAAAAFTAYWYLDCCVYRLAHLARGQIRTDVMPLFGVLLGNDYISRHVFAKFFANVSTRNVGKRNSPQQKRIIGLLRWLRNETLATAKAKVLGSVELGRRGWLAKEIEQAMEGYVRASSEAFGYFGLEEKDVRAAVEGEKVVEEWSEEEAEEEEEEGEQIESDAEPQSGEEDEADDVDDDQGDAESDHPPKTDSNSEPDDCEEEDADTIVQFRNHADRIDAPAWLRRHIHEANVPRYIVDLVSLRMYINAPQVENVQMIESNFIARAILSLIFTLVLPDAAGPEEELVYLTRDTRNASTFVNEKLAAVELKGRAFAPEDPASNVPIVLSVLFHHHPPDSVQDIINEMPADERLFALSLAYAARHSTNLKRPHLHALLLCMFALHRCREHCTYEDVEHFERQHRRYVATHAASAAATSSGRTDPASATKVDDSSDRHNAIMLSRNLMAHLQLNKTIRSKHTSFSASIVHAFAEWQAVVFHMNTLNTLLGGPFERMHIGRLFNGTLAYNLTVTLAERPDMNYYVRQYLFKDCEKWAGEYERVVAVLAPLVEGLVDGEGGLVAGGKKKKATRNQRKLTKKRQTAAAAAATATIAAEEERAEAEADDDDPVTGYDGIGNRFANFII